jgi:excisionase family DNA binding protein
MEKIQPVGFGPNELVEYLGNKNITVKTIYDLVRTGQIPHRKIGGKLIQFHKETIDAWLKEQEQR